MATDLLTPGAWRFAGANPFQRYDSYYGPGGLLQGYDPAQGPVYGLGGDNPTLMNPERRDAWMASDELLASDPELFGNATNLKVVSQDENGYTVMRKTADKEGTLIRIEKDPQTGEWVSKGAVGKEGWDTNAARRAQNLGLGSVLAAPALVAGGQALGLIPQGTVGGLASGAAEAGLWGGVEGLGGLAGGATFGPASPEITAEMLAGANATSDPIAYLNAQAGWTAADPAYMATLTTVPSGTITPGYQAPPSWPEAPPTSPPGTQTPPPVDPAKAATTGGLVKSVADMLGISESAARLLVAATPALAGLLSDHDDQTATTTQGTPAQLAARDAIATSVTGRLPEMMQRDRQRADQQMAWGNLAAGVPDLYTRPAPIAAPSMVASAFAPGGQGMMGNYKPRGIFGT
jgi:hypothetical protein